MIRRRPRIGCAIAQILTADCDLRRFLDNFSSKFFNVFNSKSILYILTIDFRPSFSLIFKFRTYGVLFFFSFSLHLENKARNTI